MKKFYTTFIMLSMAVAMHASFHLSFDKWVGDDLVSIDITKDTTLIITEYEYDEDLEEATMGVEGVMYSDESQNIDVVITRSSTGIIDQFCAAGNCVPGNGELTQKIYFSIGSSPAMRRWFTHYTPLADGAETITYAFNDGTNPVITLTIKYSYNEDKSAVENIAITPQHTGIYNLLGQRMSSNNLSELPAGIYIVNGKKIIKQ